MSTTVFVAGAGGYIGNILYLNYFQRVIPLLDLLEMMKGERLVSLFENDNFTYVVVEEAEAKGAFDKPVEGSPTY